MAAREGGPASSEKPSGRVRRGLLCENSINGGPVAARAEFLNRLRLAKQAGDPGKRLEMIGACAFWREKKHHDVDPLLIDRIEVDRIVKAREDAEALAEIWKLAMRDCDAGAHAGRPEPLPLNDEY